MNDDFKNSVRAALASKLAGIMAGAGVSFDSGLPSWSGLLQELVESYGKMPGSNSFYLDQLRAMKDDKSKHLALASILKDELGNHFGTFIETQFADPALEPNPIHRALIRLPFKYVITTNYDALIEDAFSEEHSGKTKLELTTYKDPGVIASCLHRGRPFICKAHGDAGRDPMGVILSERDYRTIIHHQPGFQSILQTLFTTHTILIVGTSFSDPDVMLLLGFIHSAFHGKTPTHYAVMPENEKHDIETKQFFKDFNIHIETLPTVNYSENLTHFLTEVAS